MKHMGSRRKQSRRQQPANQCFALVAPLLAALAGCNDNFPDALTTPSRGFQIAIPPFEVPAGQEIQDCYYLSPRITKGMHIHRIVVDMAKGSHHMNLFRFDSTGTSFKDGDIERGCWSAVAFDRWSLVVNSQSSDRIDWTLPDGVFQRIEPTDLFMLQTHYVNATTQKSPQGAGRVTINFYESEPGTAKYEMGAMFANNRAIRLPPLGESSFTTSCAFPQDVNLVSVTGHFHSRGKTFEIGTTTDGAGANYKKIFESTNWDEPPTARFSPGLFVPANGTMRYTCSFFNPTNQVITFGPHVETDEHCNLFAYYYPALPSRRPIYCF